MKYKLANIQETEAARQNLLASRSAKSSSDVASIEQLKTNSAGGDLATFRYQKAYATPFIPASFGRQSDGKDKSHPGGTVAPSDPPAPSHPTVPLPESATDRGRGGARSTEYQPKSTGTRSDDFMVHQFKKVSQYNPCIKYSSFLCFYLVYCFFGSCGYRFNKLTGDSVMIIDICLSLYNFAYMICFYFVNIPLRKERKCLLSTKFLGKNVWR